MPAIRFTIPCQVVRPAKRYRRTATSVLAGEFDSHLSRDVLTSVLNGIPPYKAVEGAEAVRRNKRLEKKARDRERYRAKKAQLRAAAFEAALDATSADFQGMVPIDQTPSSGLSAFWRARPSIHIASLQRSVSVTPPPPAMLASPPSTPEPPSSYNISRTSSKRLRTPYEEEEDVKQDEPDEPVRQPRKKKRVAVRKGWKGWVEGSPPPSEKLINLDAAPVLQERRTRSGKSFDTADVEKEEEPAVISTRRQTHTRK